MNYHLIEITKIIVFAAVLFVWVVRYNNIVTEFRSYNYPEWLRDLVGITKISLVIMLMSKDIFLVQLGATGIMVLMLAAMITHVKVKNPLLKMLPSMVLFALSGVILVGTTA